MELEDQILGIKTTYWRSGKIVKTNSSKDVDRAVAQAIYHMRKNTYGAQYMEVYDVNDANLLHAQVKRSPATGKTVIYERSQDKLQANRYAATPLFNS